MTSAANSSHAYFIQSSMCFWQHVSKGGIMLKKTSLVALKVCGRSCIWYWPLVCFVSLQIVNLKRFQFLNGRWVKSHKIVNFPLVTFDPSQYLAPRKHSLCKCNVEGNQPDIGRHGDGGENPVMGETECQRTCDKNDPGKSEIGFPTMLLFFC